MVGQIDMFETGKKIICPHCGETTPPQRKTIEDPNGGFAMIEEFHCLFCNGLLPAKTDAKPQNSDNTPNTAGLKGLLGLKDDELVKPVIKADENEKRFCRDCQFYVAHPFLSRCDKHKRTADPMGDCRDFIRRNTETKEENRSL